MLDPKKIGAISIPECAARALELPLRTMAFLPVGPKSSLERFGGRKIQGADDDDRANQKRHSHLPDSLSAIRIPAAFDKRTLPLKTEQNYDASLASRVPLSLIRHFERRYLQVWRFPRGFEGRSATPVEAVRYCAA